MSFDPHAYRVALLEQLTAGSTPLMSPNRRPHASSTASDNPVEVSEAPNRSSVAPSRSVFDALGPSSSSAAAPVVTKSATAIAATPAPRNGVVLENSTLSMPGEYPEMRRRRASAASPFTFVSTPAADRRSQPVVDDGLVQSHIQSSFSVQKARPRDATTALGAAADASTPMFSILEESPRSLIADFVDRCIASGVPDDVIADHVRFMMYSMREIVSLHEALHARFQHDRVRDFEINQLTNMVEQQYALATTTRGPMNVGNSGGDEEGMMLSPLPVPPVVCDPPKEAEMRSLSSALRQASEEEQEREKANTARLRARQQKPVREAEPVFSQRLTKAKRTSAQKPTRAGSANLREASHVTRPYHSRSPIEEEDERRHGVATARTRQTRYAVRPTVDVYTASSSSSSSELDLESLRREKRRLSTSPPSASLSPRGRHASRHHSATRGCPCCQPNKPQATTQQQQHRRSPNVSTHRAVAKHVQPSSLPHPHHQQRKHAKPPMSRSPHGTPGFMASTQLSRTRERLVETDRRLAQEETAQEEAARSPSRGSSVTRGGSLSNPNNNNKDGAVNWVPPRSTRASELRAAFVAQKALEKAMEQEAAVSPLSPTRPAPAPPSSSSSVDNDAAQTDRALYSGAAGLASSSLQLSPPPRFEKLPVAARAPNAPPQQQQQQQQQQAPAANAVFAKAISAAAAALGSPRRTRDRGSSTTTGVAPAHPDAAEAVRRTPWHHTRAPTPPVQVTSPRLQLFLERGQQKVREAERVLTQTPPAPSSLNTSAVIPPYTQREPQPQPRPPLERIETHTMLDETFRIHELRPHTQTTSVTATVAAAFGAAYEPQVVSGSLEREAVPDVVSGQSPLVMISPTTSSSDGDVHEASAVDAQRAGIDVTAGEDRMNSQAIGLTPDQKWRMLYGTPRGVV